MVGRPLYREPDLTLGCFSLWVYGRSYPGSDDFWDGNWLQCKAQVKAGGSRVEVIGPFLRNTELLDFLRDLSRISDKLTGTAELDCLEPNLSMVLTMNALGHVAVEVSITPDHLTESHQFSFEVDQTFLPPIVRAFMSILERFPVIGKL